MTPVQQPGQTLAQAKAVANQANFDRACTIANASLPLIAPVVPILTAKIGDDGALAVNSAILLVKNTCAKPLDITNPDAIIQSVYDSAGQIMAAVVKSLSST